MAVTQYFTVELLAQWLGEPRESMDLGTVVPLTLSRQEAETLCADLTEALGLGDVPSPEESIQDVLAGFLAQLNTGGYEQMLEDHPVGPPMSPDEALARVQATAASQSVPAGPVRNPGTGIGNG